MTASRSDSVRGGGRATEGTASRNDSVRGRGRATSGSGSRSESPRATSEPASRSESPRATSGPAKRTYGGVSADERRAQRRTALLDAALEIIGTQGIAKLTVAGLCAQAGLNERYYYESFDSRDAVLAALIDRIAEELAGAIIGALQTAPADTRAKAHAAISAGIHLLTDDPRKAHVALVAGMATPELRARTDQTVRVFARIVAAEGIDFYGITDPNPDPTIDFRATYLVGGLIQTLTAWLQNSLPLTRDELINHTTDVFVLLGEDLARRLAPHRR
ncbi:TetR/AcrR family transcriptional regulator [Nocardia anaemiae]|uniref:TetR/AcrR family transcriptional regulator n=1 Tax=Nocardia anaemiae TaxID=263910 RepID=UPI000AEA252C|nr:TetR/AcrR family transcriptional regulator [Nocardia anaemiae]